MEIKVKLNDNYAILVITGNIILSEIHKLREKINFVINENKKNIIIDLSDVDFIDSAGIGLIGAIYKTLKTKNGQLILVGLRKKPLEIFKLIKLDKIIKNFDNIEDAINFLKINGEGGI